MSGIGIVGGLGPFASLYFYHRLLSLSGARDDELYPPAVLVAEQVPSRIDHQMGRGPSPLPALIRSVRTLEQAGVSCIALPSATTHWYWPELSAAVSVPIPHLLTATGAALRRAGRTRPLVLATEATAKHRSFEPHLTTGSVARYPEPDQQLRVDDLIRAVKRGDSVAPLRRALAALIRRASTTTGPLGTDSVVLGCTELSVIAPDAPLPVPVVDVTDVLVGAVLATHQGAPTSRSRQLSEAIHDD
ncbi:aspartate/glutamate racemase family protein [Pseudonocardia alni]|uniref:Aspartate racemase n=1 Tax=Pseudonocardia alni TaxID=33907 RepID=A0A852WDF9_PSEA5|nr:aspartate/glutamate racemase family protein [Pseudonocardia antarctica]NYG05401.1 aspartate racemase [Pseudonocardia antarctica]